MSDPEPPRCCVHWDMRRERVKATMIYFDPMLETDNPLCPECVRQAMRYPENMKWVRKVGEPRPKVGEPRPIVSPPKTGATHD